MNTELQITEAGIFQIDGDTGTIIGEMTTTPLALPTDNPDKATVAQYVMQYAWKCGRIIQAIEKSVYGAGGSIETIDAEIARLTQLRNHAEVKLMESRTLICEYVKNAMAEMGADKIALDGIGTFRHRKLPDKVIDNLQQWDDGDAVPYQQLSLERQHFLAQLHPDLFVIKTTVQPVKAEIKKALQQGSDIPYFKLEVGERRFEFATKE